MALPNNLIDSLASSLISQVSNFFENVSASPNRSLAEFEPSDNTTGVYVIYSSSGMPLSVGHVGRNTTRGRQAPPADVAALRSMPGTTYRTVDVGDEALAAHLARLIGDLFDTMLPFGDKVGNGRVVVNHEEQVAEAPKRRGRPARNGAAKGGRKRGRRAVAVQDVQQDGVAAEQPRRRGGRKPGSKNRPKVQEGGDGENVTPKKRGRPFGSKNKPKA